MFCAWLTSWRSVRLRGRARDGLVEDFTQNVQHVWDTADAETVARLPVTTAVLGLAQIQVVDIVHPLLHMKHETMEQLEMWENLLDEPLDNKAYVFEIVDSCVYEQPFNVQV